MPIECLIVVIPQGLGAQSFPRGEQRAAHDQACNERAREGGRARARAYQPASGAWNGLWVWSRLAPRRGSRRARAG